MTTQTENLPKIINAIRLSATGKTVAELSQDLSLSPSRTRELLKIAMTDKMVDRAPQVPGSRTLVYFIPQGAPSTKPKAKAKKSKLPSGRVKGRITADSGKGKPGAKKIVNPQRTLELKKAFIAKNGGSMKWATGRVWHIDVGSTHVSMTSREMATITIGELCKMFNFKIGEDPS